MKAFRLFTLSLFTGIIFSFSAAAQANAQATKIGLIDTQAFGETGGIKKYADGRTTLEKEFAPVNAELQTMGTRYGNLEKEINNMREQVGKPGSTVTAAAVQAKIEEYDKLGRDIQYKQEDAKARSVTRYNAVMGPVIQDIGKAIQEYSKQKGYTIIFDASKLASSGLILAIGDTGVDVTKDFITYYNARPAGATTTAAPK